MTLWRRFLNLFRRELSPVAQRMAELLAPDRWDEWRLDSAGPRFLHHTALQMSIFSCSAGNYSYLHVFVGEVRGDCCSGLSSKETRILARLAGHLRRHLEQSEDKEALDRLSAHLMTAEERAIEELLR